MSTATLLPPTTHGVPTRPRLRVVGPGETYHPQPTGQVRLTRRGRVVVFLMALGVLAAIALTWSSGSVATDSRGAATGTEVITVHTGDTLWDIASERADGGDVSSVMAEITRLNALEDGLVYAGQRLRVPTD